MTEIELESLLRRYANAVLQAARFARLAELLREQIVDEARATAEQNVAASRAERERVG